MRPRVLVGLLAALIAWVPGVVAHGDEGISWTVAVGDDGTPRPNFVYEASPGQVVEDTWVVGNSGTEALLLQVYAADAFTTSSGQLDLQASESVPVGVGAWVSPSVDSVTIAPGEEEQVGFTLVVPADAPPGDYAGGLVTALSEETQGTVQLERRLATRIHVRVPGELSTSLSVGDLLVSGEPAINPFAPVALDLSYTVTNDGTARAFGRETITVAGPGGLGRTTVTRETAETLPGSTLALSLGVQGVWALGPTRVSVEVVPEGIDGSPGAPVTAEASLWLVPWGWLGILALLVAGAVVLGVLRGRRSWQWVDPAEVATAPTDD